MLALQPDSIICCTYDIALQMVPSALLQTCLYVGEISVSVLLRTNI